MFRISDKVLGYMAAAAETVAKDAMGFASRGYSYEPEMPEEVKDYKASHTSRIEALFDKIVK
ncbi:MAG: cyclic lactone autoinducer peptide [bacterium]|nr:cyclic lactone autoinducer peptide [bacterium]